ncbi:hypothetical protein [Alkalibacillus haloalkaliphilus]|uniref:hypothetical protein n=1 Tax=Alkalibacillus haloalkaliphilus TaxID=94136 RepID=UPI00293625CD|nr:hypothetical protein [Alkalibacillus haloalkaliphilus]MDV2582580.1 hypothetical protein [Alkalibacillus haloalkaliphilus]
MSTLLNIILYSLPTLIALLFLYWVAKDVWFNFNVKNDKKIDEIIRQNNELKQEIADLKKRIQ